jgi:DNA-binding HxlR family transcriptional regulator
MQLRRQAVRSDREGCPAAAALEVIGERWSLLALRELFYGVHRFDRIVERTGAPRNILSARLRHLEAEGVLERRRYQQAPARYEYHLTEAGKTLLPVVLALMAWGNEHLVREPKLMHHTCGSDLRAVTVCADCGEEAHAADVTAPWVAPA